MVDDPVVDIGRVDLDGAGEELGNQQVLLLRGDLHDSVRRRGANTGIPEQP